MPASISGDAEQYKGVPYRWAGWLPSTGWDCSGFVGYVLGHDLGLKLPLGTTWNAKVHPAVAASYKTYGTATESPQAGDLAVWLTHVGICVSSSQMISALNPEYGTAITGIQGYGPPGEPLSFRTVPGAPATTTQTTGAQVSPTAASGCAAGLILLPALIPYYLIRRKMT